MSDNVLISKPVKTINNKWEVIEVTAKTSGFEVQKAMGEWVDAHGIKQAAIARATGIPKHRVHDILRAKSAMKAGELLLICNFIDKKPNDFVEIE